MANYNVTTGCELVATFRMEKTQFDARFGSTRAMAMAIKEDRPELEPCSYTTEYTKICGVWYWVIYFWLVSDKLNYTEITE